MNYWHTTNQKEICKQLFFFKLHIRFFKILQLFCLFEIAWSRAFQTFISQYLQDIFFKHFTSKQDFAKKNFIQQILKVEHKSFPMMYHLSNLYIKHGIQRGTRTPQRILVFNYLNRDRVKIIKVVFLFYGFLVLTVIFKEHRLRVDPKHRSWLDNSTGKGDPP